MGDYTYGANKEGVIADLRRQLAEAKAERDRLAAIVGLLKIVEHDDGFWLHVNGETKAAVFLGRRGPIVNKALSEAAEKARGA